MNGTHIVLDRESVVAHDLVHGRHPRKFPGCYNEYVYWDVHISDSGEYVHAAPWSVGVSGLSKTCHTAAST